MSHRFRTSRSLRRFLAVAVLGIAAFGCSSDDDAVATSTAGVDAGGSSGEDESALRGAGRDGQIEVDGRQRLYRIYVPERVQEPAPLVIAMHGNGTDRNSFADKSGFDEVADREGWLVVYPDADAGVGGVWNGGFSQRSKDIDDVAFLVALVDKLSAQYPVDLSRVYATGLSGGGMMAYRLACEEPGLLAAIAPVGATMVGECDPEVPVPVLHIHGADDTRIPIAGRADREFPPVADVVRAWSEFDGCDPEPRVATEGVATITSWGGCDSGAEVQFYAVEGVGHDYPRADQGDPLESRDIIVDFFNNHSRDG